MRHFIFITTEGTTYMPDSLSPDDPDNSQVLGFSDGENAEEAFKNLLENESWLKETTFDEAIAYELLSNKIEGYGHIKFK